MRVQRLNCYVRDRKDRKNFSDPVTALEWSKALEDFHTSARYEAANLAAHNWDVTIVGDRLLLHSHWSKGKWYEKQMREYTPMTEDEQAVLHLPAKDRWSEPLEPDFPALIERIRK